MTELSFLVDLLLNHKLPKVTREAVAARIREVEAEVHLRGRHVVGPSQPMSSTTVSNLPPQVAKQAPSMQAIMMRHPDLVATQQRAAIEPALHEAQQKNANVGDAPHPVAVVAQNAATAAAMASRNQAIKGKLDESTGRPRKF